VRPCSLVDDYSEPLLLSTELHDLTSSNTVVSVTAVTNLSCTAAVKLRGVEALTVMSGGEDCDVWGGR
jgi:hypothetical protein